MSKHLLALYGLKWNPFGPELPTEALRGNETLEPFLWRIEHSLARDGGFALITGDPGTGKSVLMRLLAERLAKLPEITVGVLVHPQSNLADFYRELGDIFHVELRPHNRWNGFKALRERWHAHLEHTLLRPVLLIDECQECAPSVLSELRLLASAHFDSRQLIGVVLAGDKRIQEKLRRDDLVPLGSRLRARVNLEFASRQTLADTLKHLLETAGNSALMTPELIHTLADHACGNFRVLTTMAGELLDAATQRELPKLDEKLFLELFAPPPQRAPQRRPTTRKSAHG